MFFASDNGAPVPAQVMAALQDANHGPAAAYGADPLSQALRNDLRSLFEAPQAEVFLLSTGTAANSLALAVLTPPWGSVLCHRLAHIDQDECGAPEFYTGGAKLIGIEGAHGRIDPAALAGALAGIGTSGVHGVQRASLSLTNATEAGTVYAPSDLAALCDVAKSAGLKVHLDGARFANALVAANATPAQMTWQAGVDIVTLGGTKNGLIGVEAVVIFDPAHAAEFALRRKRGGHLASKYRYMAAQMRGWLAEGLWLDLARDANAMAARLAAGLARVPGARIIHPVEANIIFAALPAAALARARAAGAGFYDAEGGTPEAPAVRLVTSWATTEAEVAAFLGHLGATTAA